MNQNSLILKGEAASGEKVRGFALLRRAAWLPKSHLLAIAVGMLAIGGFTAFVIQQNYQTTWELWDSELGTSARYETWTLQSSIQQSQDDAQMLADSRATKRLLEAGRDPGAQASLRAALRSQVLSRFEEYRTIYEYGALYLFDAVGKVAVQSINGGQESTVSDSPQFQKVFGSALRNRRFAVAFGPGIQNELSLIFTMPVFAEFAEGGAQDRSGSAAHAPIGAVVVVDPFARDLLPLLTAKRLASRTGETVLLQVEGGHAHYVWAGRYPAGRTSRSLVPDTLRQAASPAIEARTTFGQFVDDRGVRVLASMRKIDNLNSVLVCKVDKKEAFADFRREVRIETVTAVSILLAYIGLIFMHNRSAVAREMQEGLERQRFVNHVLETTVAERTKELALTNQQLYEELGERQKAEAEVRRFNVELDQRVHDRTAELEVANKELEAFSYSVSHDLRAPLRRMRGFSTILLEEHAPQLPDDAQQLLQVVNKNAVQMGELIDCLLEFSQLGRQPLRKQKVSPADLVLLAWQDLSAEREGREVDLNLGDLAVCEADPLLLKQVFVNLLSNALKYSRPREFTQIEVGCTSAAAYYVRDNGVGFDMRYANKLFGVFKRLHRAEDYEGIGIGLATVERIIHRHGGRIWADAMVNQGATFSFTLA